MLVHRYYTAPIGTLELVAEEGRLLGIWMENQKYFRQGIEELPAECPDDPCLREAVQWLDRYFAGENPPIPGELLAPRGSEFRKLIWSFLCEIPYGEAVTYGELAEKAAAAMGRAHMSAQAVGGAVGHNPLSIIVPCHRVVGSDGSLTGYAGGLDRKLFLLRLEGVDVSRFTLPSSSDRYQIAEYGEFDPS